MVFSFFGANFFLFSDQKFLVLWKSWLFVLSKQWPHVFFFSLNFPFETAYHANKTYPKTFRATLNTSFPLPDKQTGHTFIGICDDPPHIIVAFDETSNIVEVTNIVYWGRGNPQCPVICWAAMSTAFWDNFMVNISLSVLERKFLLKHLCLTQYVMFSFIVYKAQRRWWHFWN